jgi:hypothetical protein
VGDKFMSSLEDYGEVIECNNEQFLIYCKIKIEDDNYYICDGYRIFENENNNYKEVKDKKILNKVLNIITLKRN